MVGTGLKRQGVGVGVQVQHSHAQEAMQHMLHRQTNKLLKMSCKNKGGCKVDILNEMTKNEILMWVRGQADYILSSPKKSDLLWYRWQAQEEKIRDRRKVNIEYGRSLNLAKRDELAKQFNSTEDIDAKLLLLKKMEPYEKKWQVYLCESRAIIKAEKKVDKLYVQYKNTKAKERMQEHTQ